MESLAAWTRIKRLDGVENWPRKTVGTGDDWEDDVTWSHSMCHCNREHCGAINMKNHGKACKEASQPLHAIFDLSVAVFSD